MIRCAKYRAPIQIIHFAFPLEDVKYLEIALDEGYGLLRSTVSQAIQYFLYGFPQFLGSVRLNERVRKRVQH